jgi:site-specific recombinase XerD
MITLWPKTVDLLCKYVEKYRITPHTLYKNRLFLNQRGKELTRHGIYRLCQKYLEKVLPAKRLKDLNPAHSFRHYGERYKMVREDWKPAKHGNCPSILSPFYH